MTLLNYLKMHATVSELYSVWDETREKRFSGDVIFRDDSAHISNQE